VHASRVASAAALAAAALLTAAVAIGATPTRSQERLNIAFHSPALDATMHARVVLPAGYVGSKRRYPVVYFLHGLPASSISYAQLDWVADAMADSGRPAILVAPQGARDNDTDPEYLDWGAGRNWETYVARDVVHYVDSRFRTIATRSGRAIVGLSAGGYGAAAIGFHHLDRFAAIESWSGYFVPTDPSGLVKLDRGSLSANNRASLHALVGSNAAAIRGRHPFFAFYVGRGDTRFRSENVQLNRELNTSHIAHVFELYAGAHTTSLWQRHAVGWLGLALKHLAPATMP
jgi:S-formylglutathione hydrolase FrmB